MFNNKYCFRLASILLCSVLSLSLVKVVESHSVNKTCIVGCFMNTLVTKSLLFPMNHCLIPLVPSDVIKKANQTGYYET